MDSTKQPFMLPPPAVMQRRLAVVATLAEGLPVRAIPEEGQVASVRHDVICDRRDADTIALEAFTADGVGSQKLPRSLLPGIGGVQDRA